MKKPPQNAHPADIVRDLRKSGKLLTSVAKGMQAHPSTISHALRRCIPSANHAIAKALGVKRHALWPEWFDAEDRRRRDPSHKAGPGNSQISRPSTDRSDHV